MAKKSKFFTSTPKGIALKLLEKVGNVQITSEYNTTKNCSKCNQGKLNLFIIFLKNFLYIKKELKKLSHLDLKHNKCKCCFSCISPYTEFCNLCLIAKKDGYIPIDEEKWKKRMSWNCPAGIYYH